ncbi:Ig-like domain-containing protein [Nocardioides limicola]|uniref:Ig-like domain-containing protein n=1 Tax=Nocardioides limicola TaxID=2803368 RepID=UPI00193BFA29|nr:Ig-like domain-containing protein [Nocardioides sp. DJM-14]
MSIRRVVSVAVATLLVTGSASVATSPAYADHSSEAHSDSRFISGSLLTGDLSPVVGIDGAEANYFDGHSTGTDDFHNANLDVTALSALTVSLPDLEIELGDLLQVGVVNQEAWAGPDGESWADTSVTDLTLDLTALLGSTDLISAASLELGAVSSYAEIDSDGALTRDYAIAEALLTLESPVIGETVTAINGAVAEAGTALVALEDQIAGALLGAVTGLLSPLGNPHLNVTITPDFDTILDGIVGTPMTSNGVTIDLATGQVRVDLEQIIDLNNLDPNSTLLSPEVLQHIAQEIESLLNELQANLNNLVVDSLLDAVDVQMDGFVCVVTVLGSCTGGLVIGYDGSMADLLDGTQQIDLSVSGTGGVILNPLLGTISGVLTTTLATVVEPLVTGILDTLGATVSLLVQELTETLSPILDVVADIVAVNINVQNTEADGIDERAYVTAVQLELLGGSGAVLDLVTSAVGPNTHLPLVPVLDATDDPVTPGTDAPVTSTGWHPDSEVTLQLFDAEGTPVGAPFTVFTDAEGNFPEGTTFPVPAGIDAGEYSLVGTDELGTTAADSLLVITPTLDVADAPVAPGGNAPVESTGWAPESEVSLQLVDAEGMPVGAPFTVFTDAEGNFPEGTTFPVPDGIDDGEYTLVGTDEFGNSAVDTVFVDGTAPVVAITSPADGSVINDPLPVFEGTTEPGALVEVYVDGTFIGTVVADGDGNWSIPSEFALADGEHTVTAVAIDEAGNASDPVSNTFTVDTTAPDVAITAPVDGSVTSDPITEVSGTTEPGALVEVFIDGASVGTVTADGDGNWTLVLDEPLTADGVYEFTATATDDAGNTSDPATVTAEIDTTAPDAPVITSPTEGSVTGDTTPTITGTGEPGAVVVVEVTDSEGNTQVLETVVNEDGTWAVEVNEPLADGDVTVAATQTDTAGNTSESANSSFVVDTSVPEVSAPPAPVVTSPADGSVLTTDTPTISGTGVPGATVTVYLNGEVAGTTTVGDDGTWSLTVGPLACGEHTITSTQTVDGETSPLGEPVTVSLPCPPASGGQAPSKDGLLPGVGAPAGLVLLGLLALLLVGGGLVLTRSRRTA